MNMQTSTQAAPSTKEMAKRPPSIFRQVLFAAGFFVLLGLALSYLIPSMPIGMGLLGFVGVMLCIAGTTGFCPMARMLAVMPWNKDQEDCSAMHG